MTTIFSSTDHQADSRVNLSVEPALITDEEPPPNGLVFQVSPHLAKLSENSPAIRRQFYPSDDELQISDETYEDPLLEDSHVVTKGLVHKYPSRVLVTLTMTCAAYCRFCTRRRIVSDMEKGKLTSADVDNMVKYLTAHPEINEVIFSGGDPVTAHNLLIEAIDKIRALPQIKVIRVHTRTPVSQPSLITPKLLKTFKQIEQPLYVSVHFEHPDEMSPETLTVIKKIQKTGAILLSQSVFLKGVNDSVEVLEELFNRLIQIGVRPYYIFRCDPTKGVEHFIVPLEKEIAIMTELRKRLSGLAWPTYVIDTPNGSGKIPVPLDFWKFDKSGHTDFLNKWHEVWE